MESLVYLLPPSTLTKIAHGRPILVTVCWFNVGNISASVCWSKVGNISVSVCWFKVSNSLYGHVGSRLAITLNNISALVSWFLATSVNSRLAISINSRLTISLHQFVCTLLAVGHHVGEALVLPRCMQTVELQSKIYFPRCSVPSIRMTSVLPDRSVPGFTAAISF